MCIYVIVLYVRIHECMWVYGCASDCNTYANAHIHVDTYTHIHTRTHVHTHTQHTHAIQHIYTPYMVTSIMNHSNSRIGMLVRKFIKL